MNDFEGVLDNSDSQLLLTRVSSLSHELIDKSFDERAGDLSEFLDLVLSCSVRNVDLLLCGFDIHV